MANKNKLINKHSLRRRLKYISLFPIIFMGIAVSILGYSALNQLVSKEVHRNLANITESLRMYYDSAYPGEYNVRQRGGIYRLYKGDVDIMDSEEILDEFKARTGADVTIFYLDVRMVTTIVDKSGNRAVRSVAQSFVADSVINRGERCFYDNVTILGETYYGYYAPIEDANGQIIGMLFAGKPTRQVREESLKSVIWVPPVVVVCCIIASIICGIPAREITESINKEKRFLREMASGNLTAQIDTSLLKRGDELGDMAKFTISVQRFIRDMIERDALTRLYTRRVGETKIAYTRHQLEAAGVSYCVAMGDIDFFKQFNDTYGHDCGDFVLREVSRIFLEYMIGKGFTVRWGGEEFLIIFEGKDIEKATESLKVLHKKIEDARFEYQEQVLFVTMTFGITAGDSRDIKEIVKEADELLYTGKRNGRNQVVSSNAK